MKTGATVFFVACASVTAALIAAWEVEVPSSQSFGSQDNPWQLPTFSANIDEVNDAYSNLQQNEVWRSPEAKQEEETEDKAVEQLPAWHFIGTVAQSDARFALVEFDGKVTRYRIGDRLPDEGLVVSIDANEIGVERNAEQESRSIFSGIVKPKREEPKASVSAQVPASGNNYWGDYSPNLDFKPPRGRR